MLPGHVTKYVAPTGFEKGSDGMQASASEPSRDRLRDLESAYHRPLTRESGAPLAVYGYLRLPTGAHDRATRLRAELQSFADRHGFLLATTFTDWGVPHDEMVRPGFAGLLGALQLATTHGVVIPAWHYLSADPDEIRELTARIAKTGCRCFIVRDGQQWIPDTQPVTSVRGAEVPPRAARPPLIRDLPPSST